MSASPSWNVDIEEGIKLVLHQAESGFCSLLFVGATRWPALLYLLPLAVLFLSSPGAHAQSPPGQRTVEGKARIVDGDTLEIGVDRIDLYGIDAPEPDQRCKRDGRQWRCGKEATYAMAALIETHWLTCHQRGSDTAGHIIAVCRMGGPKGLSVNQEIVRRGWALAVRPSGGDYVAAEQDAKAAKMGLWSGTFDAPWEWRRIQETGKTGN